MLKGKIFNRVVIKVDVDKANYMKGLLIDSNWGHEGKHMTHDGVVVENDTDLDVEIGSEVWFDYRIKWEDDKRYDSLGWDGTEEKGFYYYILPKETYKDIVRCSNDKAVNDYIGFIRPNKEKTTASGIFLPLTVIPPDDRGTVVIPNGDINKGVEIVYAEDNDYPNDAIESEWIEYEGKNIIFTSLEYIFGTIEGDEFKPYGNWIIMEALDEDEVWEEQGGIFLPRKERVTKGLGRVAISGHYEKGTELIYAKRGYNSFKFKEEKYYAVTLDNVLIEL